MLNPHGTVGVVTLWSRIDFVLARLAEAGADLSPESSPIAVLGNLYGEGLRYLLRNLLHNPQIDTLLVFGRDKSGSLAYLRNFFTLGTEPAGADVEYTCSRPDRPVRAVRVKNTSHVMDDLVGLHLFSPPPEIVRIEGADREGALEAARFLAAYMPSHREGPRLAVEVPDVALSSFPSNPRAHTVVEDAPSTAWKSLVHRLFRFGKRVQLAKGLRIELQNVKVVVEKPRFEDDDVIRGCGFDPEGFRRYREDILSPLAPADQPYTYGNRLRSYFGLDGIDAVVEQLRLPLDDRGGYVTTWDNRIDIAGPKRPCLVSLFFRVIDGLVYLTAGFRTHNASNAWLENVYGLMAIQEYAAERSSLGIGSIIVFSHSISLDPQYLEKAKTVHDEVAATGAFRKDPHGYFMIAVEGKEIVLTHCSGGNVIGEYRSEKPERIQNQLYRDCAVSDINHALYIGRQLEKAYLCIQDGREYVQE